jgi:DNA helicase HerA-like ATPase
MPSNVVISIFGRKGGGKSFLTKEIIEEHRRVFIFDTVGEYEGAIESFEAGVQATLEAQEKRRFKIAFRIVNDEDALRLMRLVYDVPRTLVVFEETSFYCSPSYLPEELARFVRYGRHREISQIYISRRPAEISRDLTAQSDIIVSFQQHEPADLEYLGRVMGPEAARELPRLPRYAIVASGDLNVAPLPILERLARQEPSPRGERKRLTEESEED